MYHLKIHKNVFKFLEKREKRFVEKLKNSMQLICENPFKNSCDVVTIVNMPGHFRLRIGKYRFLYEVSQDEVFVYFYKADSRGSIYK